MLSCITQESKDYTYKQLVVSEVTHQCFIIIYNLNKELRLFQNSVFPTHWRFVLLQSKCPLSFSERDKNDRHEPNAVLSFHYSAHVPKSLVFGGDLLPHHHVKYFLQV